MLLQIQLTRKHFQFLMKFHLLVLFLGCLWWNFIYKLKELVPLAILLWHARMLQSIHHNLGQNVKYFSYSSGFKGAKLVILWCKYWTHILSVPRTTIMLLFLYVDNICFPFWCNSTDLSANVSFMSFPRSSLFSFSLLGQGIRPLKNAE